ncbi:MAG TPA: hypothetical protein VKT72_13915 [Candidatus Baltobacteraceae bacterium]|nr:hypothetical protein [Candidatus Baltobacteraceae bacterium]
MKRRRAVNITARLKLNYCPTAQAVPGIVPDAFGLARLMPSYVSKLLGSHGGDGPSLQITSVV